MAKLLTLKEIRKTKGAGWLETWFPPDDGEPEYKLLTECAWLHGAIINRNSPGEEAEMLMEGYVQRDYGKRYGCRVWDEKPTDEERGVRWK